MRAIALLSLFILVLGSIFSHPQAGSRENSMALKGVQHLNKSGRANDALKKLAEIEPSVEEALRWAFHAQRGDTYLLLNRLTEAAAEFSTSLEFRQTTWVQLRYASVLQRLGEWSDASEVLASLDHKGLPLNESMEYSTLKAICDGPFASMWPNAHHILEATSPMERYSVISNLATNDQEMATYESQLQTNDTSSSQPKAMEAKSLDSVVALAALLEETAQAMLESVGLNMNMLPEKAVFRVVAIRERPTFEEYANTITDLSTLPSTENQTVGFYSTSHKVLVLHALEGEAIADTGLTTATLRTLLHEMWHQLLDTMTLNPPRWLDEGLAEYFASCTYEEDGIAFGQLIREYEADKEGMQEVSRFETLSDALENGPYESLATFFEARSSLEGWRDGDVDLMYAEAWSLAYYALKGPNSDFQTRYLAFLKELIETNSSRDLQLFKTSQGAEIKELEAKWKRFWQGMAKNN